jgi:hypothetical protein
VSRAAGSCSEIEEEELCSHLRLGKEIKTNKKKFKPIENSQVRKIT